MSFRTMNPPEARGLLESDEEWSYLDVRTVDEFELGHAEGAWNIPFAIPDPATMQMRPNPEFVAVVNASFGSESKLVVACAAGGRSNAACETLEAEGFTNLINMHGGFSGARDPAGTVLQPGWQDLAYPVSTSANAERTYEHLQRRQ